MKFCNSSKSYLFALPFALFGILWFLNIPNQIGSFGSVAKYGTVNILDEWELPGDCFTQGLTYLNSTHVVMTCGGYGTSRIIVLSGFESDSLSVSLIYKASSDDFLEGCTVVDDSRLLVLTWREGKLLEFGLPLQLGDVPKIHVFRGEGWGIAYDGSEVWVSDGSDKLTVLDSISLERIRQCVVTLSHDGKITVPVKYMNELEFIGGYLFANIYIPAGDASSPNYIVKIDTRNACRVETIFPAFQLNRVYANPGNVMNGIAHSIIDQRVLLTGKNWGEIYSANFAAGFKKVSSKMNITHFLNLNLGFR